VAYVLGLVVGSSLLSIGQVWPLRGGGRGDRAVLWFLRGSSSNTTAISLASSVRLSNIRLRPWPIKIKTPRLALGLIHVMAAVSSEMTYCGRGNGVSWRCRVVIVWGCGIGEIGGADVPARAAIRSAIRELFRFSDATVIGQSFGSVGTGAGCEAGRR